MAQTLDFLRNTIITSIWGRRFGMDKNDMLVGQQAIRNTIQDLTTSSSGTRVPAYGVSCVTCTGSSQGPVQFILDPPIPGVEKTLVVNSSSTGSFQFFASGVAGSTAAGASILGLAAGTTTAWVNLIGGLAPATVKLMALSTARWMVVSNFTTGGVSFSTST